MVFGTGEKGNRLESSRTRARARGATEWAKALRVLWTTTAAGGHTETRDWLARHEESTNYLNIMFSGF